MPKSYTSSSEARSALLQQSKKWREDFKALKEKSKKAEEQALIKTVDGALDELVSSSAHLLERQEELDDRVEKLGEGVDVANKLAEQFGHAVEDLQKNVKEDEASLQSLIKKTDEVERKTRSSLSMAHTLQLERASTGIICRNIRPVTVNRYEKYEELEKAFTTTMAAVGYVPPVAYIRRLQRVKGDDKPGPAPLLVTLTTPGERAKLYSAIDRTTKAGKQLGFSVTSEIPKYAIPTYKYMGRLATIIRAQFPELKTRVNIPRGDVWPTVLVKHNDDTKFIKADTNMLEHAKSEYVRANKERAANKSKRTATSSTASDGTTSEPMDVGSSTGGRPQRQVRKPKP